VETAGEGEDLLSLSQCVACPYERHSVIIKYNFRINLHKICKMVSSFRLFPPGYLYSCQSGRQGGGNLSTELPKRIEEQKRKVVFVLP
jgi:hypothetical protein